MRLILSYGKDIKINFSYNSIYITIYNSVIDASQR